MAGPCEIDLHIHSTYSDGLLSPKAIVDYAHNCGLRAIALTDHDEVSGYFEACEAAQPHGLEIIPGIEISSMYHDSETHILGYLFDPHNENLLYVTERFRIHRVERAKEIVARLRHMGMPISFDVVRMRAGHGALGRPHIADIMVEEGYVFSFQEAFQKYLGEHKPGYVPKMKLSVEDAISLIHNAGGLAFVAHPGINTDTSNIHSLIEMGLDGIETMHPKHSPFLVESFQELVRKHNLLETGGSDCHGARRGEMMLGTLPVPYRFLAEMKSQQSMRDVTVRLGQQTPS